MNPARAVRQREIEIQAWLRQELPEWESWSTAMNDGRTVWGARPHGAPRAVITDQPSPGYLIIAVRAYQRDLPRHLDHVRTRIAGLPETNIGRDEAAVLKELLAVLEGLQAQLEVRQARVRGAAVTEMRDVLEHVPAAQPEADAS